jgi:hypothetical protein
MSAPPSPSESTSAGTVATTAGAGAVVDTTTTGYAVQPAITRLKGMIRYNGSETAALRYAAN